MTTTTIQDLEAPPSAGRKSVLFFWASWYEPSNRGSQMDTIFETLAGVSTEKPIDFYRVEAEQVPSVSEKYKVTVVPTFVLLDEAGIIVDRVEGADDVPRLTQSVSALALRSNATTTTTTTTTSTTAATDTTAMEEKNETEILSKRLKSLIHSSQVMVFIKGTPTEPRCGFSRQMVELLTDAKISFGSFDILSDEKVRQGLKLYSDWPTYPQLYVKGELVGGLDIVKELVADTSTSLADELSIIAGSDVPFISSTTTTEKDAPQPSLEDRLSKLVKRHPVMLFMKGLPSAPRCGFSRKIVEILEDAKVSFDSFDILGDEEVRQGLKKFSDWPTYPQLYIDGDLVGGLDIVKEMAESGELKDMLEGK